MSRSYRDCGKLKEKLDVGVKELEEIGFIAPMTSEERYKQEGRGRWRVTFTRHTKKPISVPLAAQQPTEPEPPPLVAELAKRGVSDKTAAELAEKHPAETIQLKIEVFDWLVSQQDKRVAKSPEGYLVKSITDGYKTPKGFESAAERQRKQEAKDAKARQEAEEHRRKRADDARDQAERKAILGHWEALTPEQQATLQAEADAQADPEALKQETGPLKTMGQTIRRHEYIRQLLRHQQKEAAEA